MDSKAPLLVTHPELAKQAADWDPSEVTAGSRKKLEWICKEKHTWLSTPCHRVRGQGCPYCGGKKVLTGFNDLVTLFPDIAREVDGWDPSKVTAGSHKKADWKCSRGHKWTVAIQYRTRGGTNCPVCAGKAVEPGFNDLATIFPELAIEAHGWDPKLVTSSSGKKVDWKCGFGHKYSAAIYSRTGKAKSGCPVCSNRQLIVGENDLTTTHPEIAKEAIGWDPTTVSSGSGRKKYNWRCPKGHDYLSYVYSRTSGIGCSVCANRTIQVGINDLKTTHSGLSQEADGWNPANFSKGSSDKLLWKCQAGHNWQARISNRAIKGHGCPICSGQQILPGFNDVLTLRPEIANQAYGWDPSVVALHSNQKMKWKCASGHIWESTVTNRVRRNDGCSVCSNHKTLAGFNDLATTDPLIASEADGWDPKTMTRSSNKVVGWKCKLGHTWKTRPATRVSGSGCPVCSGHQVLIGFNDLQTLYSEIARQADGWDTRTVTKSSNKVLPWICDFGHRSKTSVNNRTSGKGCAVCANQSVLIGFNDLSTSHPELAKQAFGWDPRTVTSGSTKKNANQWICSLGHIWKATVALRSSGSQCPICAGQKVWAGFNDLATTHPQIARQAYEWDPTTLMAGSDKVRDWKCDLGHIWKVRIADRKAGNNCPICSGQRVLAGFNDLITTHPLIAAEAHNWDPKTLTAGSGLKRKFKCPEGHIYETDIGHRTSKKATGCPSCAQTGFDPNQDGYLYFLKQESWEMYQIGITNVPDDRLNRHNRNGWELLELRGPMDGHLTQQWETAILRMLKAKGADLSNSKIAGKFDGYSEAWSKSTFEVKSIKELMKLTEEFEDDSED